MTPPASPVPVGACGLFVTGTDTEVGKTRVSAALLHALAQAGWRVAGYKPVAAGTAPDAQGLRFNEDVAWLQAASPAALGLSAAEVGPCVLDTACAPHLAARKEGRTLVAEPLLAGAAHLARRADAVLVEGVGGFCVPLQLPDLATGEPGHDTADLAARLGWPVVLVVGLRLGCLNHALLTAEAVHARGLLLAGWVGNSLQACWPEQADNLAALQALMQRRFGAPCLGRLPWCPDPQPATLAPHLDTPRLLQRLGWPIRPAPEPRP